MARRTLVLNASYCCAYCGGPADTVDHVILRSRGGHDRRSNLVAACRRCNSTKDDHLLAELGWTLRTTPHQPLGIAKAILGQLEELDPLWEPYVGVVAA